VNEQHMHTDDMEDIISAPPKWLLRWGISLFFAVLILIFGLSALIRYPDIIKTQLKISSANAPSPIVSRVSGKLVKLLVKENQLVISGQSLAYLESTADHEQVLRLLNELQKLQEELLTGKQVSLRSLNTLHYLQLGELQSSYQEFFHSYLTFKASMMDGIYLKRKAFLQKDLANILSQKGYLLSQKNLLEKEYDLARQEYEMHQKLAEQKVESKMEFKREESKFLASQNPLQQTETSLLLNSSTYFGKEKEIIELDNQIQEEKSKFIQALNSLISEAENWKKNYVLRTIQPGIVLFAGLIKENQVLNIGQEVFYINPKNAVFLGEMHIPQYNMGKVKEGQEVLIKLQSYPYEEYGILTGNISTISDIPYKDSIFLSKVTITNDGFAKLKRTVHLKNGMNATAEIITEEGSLLSRISRNITKMLK
jgi:multidrug efflux pump subunit AcrA (membrane-fusion protein)